MQVEIISTGDEIITGFITDTNVSWLCQELLSLGIQARLRHTVGDRLDDITELLLQRSKHCDIILVNGGLGPTSDDNTTEAAAAAAGVPRILNEAWLKKLKKWHQDRGRIMPPANTKQAMLPKGALLLDNPNGTACGFALKINKAMCFFTPGVPSEFKAMYLNEIKPIILKDFIDNVQTRVKRLFLFGISESLLAQKISALNLPKSIVTGYRAAYPLLELKLILNAAAQSVEQDALERILPVIKNYLLCEDTFDLPERIENLSNHEGFCLFDNVTAGTLAYELSSKASLVSAYLSVENLTEKIKEALISGNARYFISVYKDNDDSSFHLKLLDTQNNLVWHNFYDLEVTLKNKRHAAISLLAQDFIYSSLSQKESLRPDNCTVNVIACGEKHDS